MNETKELAGYIAEIKYEDFGPDVIQKAKSLLLDQLGCQLAFATLPWSKGVIEYIRARAGCREESTIVYYGVRTLAEDAAFANAIFGHGFEMDDTEMNTITHPGSVVIPAALAFGEREKASGRDFLTAMVAGYEAMIRVGLSVRSSIERSFHGTSVSGPFGSAAAVSKILGFGPDAILNSFGIAASQSSGVSEYTISGGSVKRLHAGFAAQAGIKAALLAERGLTGPAAALEGKKGFCQAFANRYYPEQITAGLGTGFKILLTGNKPYCCCAGQHSAIDAAQGILDKHPLKSADIEEILIEQMPREFKSVGNIVEPGDITAAQFSGRFGVALRLVKGSNGYRDYTLANIKDAEILGLVKKSKYQPNNALEELESGGAPAIVTITLKDGSTITNRVNYAKGTIQNRMTAPEVEDKFRGLASVNLSSGQVEQVIQTVAGLENLDNIGRLAALLVPRK